MTLFYLSAAVLLLLAVAFVVWPFVKQRLSKKQQSQTLERQKVNVSLYQDHLADLQSSLEQGAIDQEQFDALKDELDRNLLEDSQTTLDAAPIASRGYSWLLWGSVAILPLLALGLYQWLGNSDSWQLKQLLEQQAQLEQQFLQSGSETDQQVLTKHNRDLLLALGKHVDRRPDDLQSQVLLARTAMEVGQLDVAIAAYQSILEKEPEAAQMMAELAQAVFMKADNQAVPVVGMLAQQAVQLQPDNAMALGLLGIFYYQQGDYKQAISPWQRAIELYPPNSPNARALTNGLTQAQARLAAAGELETAESTQDSADKPAQASVKVAVSLAPDVPVDPSHTVFIYARAWQGPKMPLAITRVSASQLPLTIELNEAMAMAPGMTLATAEQVELVARLSPTGNAIAQVGDWQASLGPVQPTSAATSVYPLVISQPLSVQ